MFSSRKPRSRGDLARAAARAQKRRKFKKALALYSEILDKTPGDREVQRKIAGLQARTGLHGDAWESFRFSAEAYQLEGFPEKAIGVYREAVHYLPRQTDAWAAISDIQLEKSQKSDAVATLLEGRGHLSRKRDRPDALRLLQRTRQIDPRAFEPAFDLVRVQKQVGDKAAALALLGELEAIATPSQRRRLRRRTFRYRPTPGNLWRWLRARSGT